MKFLGHDVQHIPFIFDYFSFEITLRIIILFQNKIQIKSNRDGDDAK